MSFIGRNKKHIRASLSSVCQYFCTFAHGGCVKPSDDTALYLHPQQHILFLCLLFLVTHVQ